MHMLAKHFGYKSTKRLRELVKQGKITRIQQGNARALYSVDEAERAVGIIKAKE